MSGAARAFLRRYTLTVRRCRKMAGADRNIKLQTGKRPRVLVMLREVQS